MIQTTFQRFTTFQHFTTFLLKQYISQHRKLYTVHKLKLLSLHGCHMFLMFLQNQGFTKLKLFTPSHSYTLHVKKTTLRIVQHHNCRFSTNMIFWCFRLSNVHLFYLFWNWYFHNLQNESSMLEITNTLSKYCFWCFKTTL